MIKYKKYNKNNGRKQCQQYQYKIIARIVNPNMQMVICICMISVSFLLVVIVVCKTFVNITLGYVDHASK